MEKQITLGLFRFLGKLYKKGAYKFAEMEHFVTQVKQVPGAAGVKPLAYFYLRKTRGSPPMTTEDLYQQPTPGLSAVTVCYGHSRTDVVFRVNLLSGKQKQEIDKMMLEHKFYFKNCLFKTVYWEKANDMLSESLSERNTYLP